MISTNNINFSFQELNPLFLFFNDKYLVKTSTNPQLNKPHSLEAIKPGLAETVIPDCHLGIHRDLQLI